MKKLFLFVLLSLSPILNAQAPDRSFVFDDGGYACLAPEARRPSAPSGLRIAGVRYSYEIFAAEDYFSERVRCDSVNRLRFYLDGTAIMMAAYSIPLACTGVGATVAVKLQVASLGMQTLSLILGQLPCESGDDEHIQQLVKDKTCEVLERNGVNCDPNGVPMRVSN